MGWTDEVKSDFKKPTIMSVVNYGIKTEVTIPHSDIGFTELADAFMTLCVGCGFGEDSSMHLMKEYLEDRGVK